MLQLLHSAISMTIPLHCTTHLEHSTCATGFISTKSLLMSKDFYVSVSCLNDYCSATSHSCGSISDTSTYNREFLINRIWCLTIFNNCPKYLKIYNIHVYSNPSPTAVSSVITLFPTQFAIFGLWIYRKNWYLLYKTVYYYTGNTAVMISWIKCISSHPILISPIYI